MKFGTPVIWDYKKQLELQTAINNLTIDGTPLSDRFEIDGWNAWHWYQALMMESVRWRTVDGITPSVHIRTVKGFIWSLATTFVFFLLSVSGIAKAIIRRPEVLIYSIDLINSAFRGDQRIHPAYAAFESLPGVRFIECFHAVTPKKTITHWWHRRRALYLEGGDFLFAVKSIFSGKKELALFSRIDFSSIPEADRPLAEAIVKNMLSRLSLSRFRIHYWRWLLRKVGIKKLLMIDDPRHIWELLAAAKKEEISTIAIQHGHYTKYHRGWIPFGKSRFPYLSPDVLLVWSDYWKKELQRIGSIFSNVVVGGYKDVLPPFTNEKKVGEVCRVLFLYETVAPKETIGQYMQSLAKEEGIQVLFKPRNDMPVNLQLQEYGINDAEKIDIMEHISKNPADDIDLAVGTYSTLLSELVMYGVPVAILETPMDYGMGLIENNVAGLLQHASSHSLSAQVRALAGITDEERLRRRNEMVGSQNQQMSDTIAEYLKIKTKGV